MSAWRSVRMAGQSDVDPHGCLTYSAQDIGFVRTVIECSIEDRRVVSSGLAQSVHHFDLAFARLQIFKRGGVQAHGDLLWGYRYTYPREKSSAGARICTLRK